MRSAFHEVPADQMVKNEAWVEDPKGETCEECGAILEILEVSHDPAGPVLGPVGGSDVEAIRCSDGCYSHRV